MRRRNAKSVIAAVIVGVVTGGLAPGEASAAACRDIERYNGLVLYTKIRAEGISCFKARRLLVGAANRGNGAQAWSFGGWKWTFTVTGVGAGKFRGERGSGRIRATYYSA